LEHELVCLASSPERDDALNIHPYLSNELIYYKAFCSARDDAVAEKVIFAQ
jgi:hypothetical protein